MYRFVLPTIAKIGKLSLSDTEINDYLRTTAFKNKVELAAFASKKLARTILYSMAMFFIVNALTFQLTSMFSIPISAFITGMFFLTDFSEISKQEIDNILSILKDLEDYKFINSALGNSNLKRVNFKGTRFNQEILAFAIKRMKNPTVLRGSEVILSGTAVSNTITHLSFDDCNLDYFALEKFFNAVVQAENEYGENEQQTKITVGNFNALTNLYLRRNLLTTIPGDDDSGIEGLCNLLSFLPKIFPALEELHIEENNLSQKEIKKILITLQKAYIRAHGNKIKKSKKDAEDAGEEAKDEDEDEIHTDFVVFFAEIKDNVTGQPFSAQSGSCAVFSPCIQAYKFNPILSDENVKSIIDGKVVIFDRYTVRSDDLTVPSKDMLFLQDNIVAIDDFVLSHYTAKKHADKDGAEIIEFKPISDMLLAVNGDVILPQMLIDDFCCTSTSSARKKEIYANASKVYQYTLILGFMLFPASKMLSLWPSILSITSFFIIGRFLYTKMLLGSCHQVIDSFFAYIKEYKDYELLTIKLGLLSKYDSLDLSQMMLSREMLEFVAKRINNSRVLRSIPCISQQLKTICLDSNNFTVQDIKGFVAAIEGVENEYGEKIVRSERNGFANVTEISLQNNKLGNVRDKANIKNLCDLLISMTMIFPKLRKLDLRFNDFVVDEVKQIIKRFNELYQEKNKNFIDNFIDKIELIKTPVVDGNSQNFVMFELIFSEVNDCTGGLAIKHDGDNNEIVISEVEVYTFNLEEYLPWLADNIMCKGEKEYFFKKKLATAEFTYPSGQVDISPIHTPSPLIVERINHVVTKFVNKKTQLTWLFNGSNIDSAYGKFIAKLPLNTMVGNVKLSGTLVQNYLATEASGYVKNAVYQSMRKMHKLTMSAAIIIGAASFVNVAYPGTFMFVLNYLVCWTHSVAGKGLVDNYTALLTKIVKDFEDFEEIYIRLYASSKHTQTRVGAIDLPMNLSAPLLRYVARKLRIPDGQSSEIEKVNQILFGKQLGCQQLEAFFDEVECGIQDEHGGYISTRYEGFPKITKLSLTYNKFTGENAITRLCGLMERVPNCFPNLTTLHLEYNDFSVLEIEAILAKLNKIYTDFYQKMLNDASNDESNIRIVRFAFNLFFAEKNGSTGFEEKNIDGKMINIPKRIAYSFSKEAFTNSDPVVFRCRTQKFLLQVAEEEAIPEDIEVSSVRALVRHGDRCFVPVISSAHENMELASGIPRSKSRTLTGEHISTGNTPRARGITW